MESVACAHLCVRMYSMCVCMYVECSTIKTRYAPNKLTVDVDLLLCVIKCYDYGIYSQPIARG